MIAIVLGAVLGLLLLAGLILLAARQAIQRRERHATAGLFGGDASHVGHDPGPPSHSDCGWDGGGGDCGGDGGGGGGD